MVQAPGASTLTLRPTEAAAARDSAAAADSGSALVWISRSSLEPIRVPGSDTRTVGEALLIAGFAGTVALALAAMHGRFLLGPAPSASR